MIEELLTAIRSNDTKLILEVIDKVNGDQLAAKYLGGNNVLHFALEKGCAEQVLNKIIDKIANNGLHAKNNNLKTPLHLASGLSHISGNVAIKLIEKGCNISELDNQGRNILHIAVNSYYQDNLVNYIIDKYSAANLHNVVDSFGYTAMHLSTNRNNYFYKLFAITDKKYFATKLNTGYNVLHHITSIGQNDSAVKNVIINKLNQEELRNLVNVPGSDGKTPLHFISDIDILQKYIKVASIETILAVGSDGKSAVHEAAGRNNIEVLKKLYQIITSLDSELTFIRSVEGKTSLHIAAEKNQDDNLKFLMVEAEKINPSLLAMKDKEGYTLLHNATSIDVADALLSKLPEMIQARNVEGKTVLHKLTNNNNYAVIEYLFEENKLNPIIVNCRDASGKTALHRAIEVNHIKIAMELINRVDKKLFNYVDNDGDSLLHVIRDVQLFKHLGDNNLIDKKIYEQKNNKNLSPIMTLIQNNYGHVVALEFLQDKSLSVSAIKSRTINGDSLLHLAVKANNGNIAKLLVSDLLLTQNNQGKTALHLAVEHGYQHLVKLLLDNNEDNNNEGENWQLLSIKDASNRTAFHYAADSNKHTILQLLFSVIENNKISQKDQVRLITSKDNFSYGALDLASMRGNEASVKILAQYLCQVVDPKYKLDIENKQASHNYAKIDKLLKETKSLFKEKASNSNNEAIKLMKEDVSNSILGNKIETLEELKVDTSINKSSYTNHIGNIPLNFTGDNIHALDSMSRTKLHYVARNGDASAFMNLLDALSYKEINALDDDGRSVLHMAAYNSKSGDFIKHLISVLDQKIVRIQDKDGLTALHIAAYYNSKIIEPLLVIMYQEDIDKSAYNGMNALHFAALNYKEFSMNSHISTLIKAMSIKAITSLDNNKQTFLEILQENATIYDIVNLLLVQVGYNILDELLHSAAGDIKINTKLLNLFEHVDKSKELRLDDPKILFVKGNIKLCLGNDEKVDEYYDKAIRICRKNLSKQDNLAAYLAEMPCASKALEKYIDTSTYRTINFLDNNSSNILISGKFVHEFDLFKKIVDSMKIEVLCQRSKTGYGIVEKVIEYRNFSLFEYIVNKIDNLHESKQFKEQKTIYNENSLKDFRLLSINNKQKEILKYVFVGDHDGSSKVKAISNYQSKYSYELFSFYDVIKNGNELQIGSYFIQYKDYVTDFFKNNIDIFKDNETILSSIGCKEALSIYHSNVLDEEELTISNKFFAKLMKLDNLFTAQTLLEFIEGGVKDNYEMFKIIIKKIPLSDNSTSKSKKIENSFKYTDTYYLKYVQIIKIFEQFIGYQSKESIEFFVEQWNKENTTRNTFDNYIETHDLDVLGEIMNIN